MDPWEIQVDLSDKDSVEAALDTTLEIVEGGDRLEEIMEANFDLVPLTYGEGSGSEFQPLPNPDWKFKKFNVDAKGLDDEAAFFYAAATHGLDSKIQDYVSTVCSQDLARDDEYFLGTFALCGLLHHSDQWADDYLKILQTTKSEERMYDNYEMLGFPVAFEAYGITSNTLRLLTARMFSFQEQHGDEFFASVSSKLKLDKALQKDESLMEAFEVHLRAEMEEAYNSTDNFESAFANLGVDFEDGDIPDIDKIKSPSMRALWRLALVHLKGEEDSFKPSAPKSPTSKLPPLSEDADLERRLLKIWPTDIEKSLKELPRYPRLTTIRAAETTLENLDFLAQTPLLTNLDLTQANIQHGWEKLKDLMLLKQLFLGGSNVNNDVLSDILAIPHLQSLDIRDSGVTGAALDQLKARTDLMYLNVDGCDFSAEQIAELREALANTAVLYREVVHG